MMDSIGRPIGEVMSAEEFRNLAVHLHNGNDDSGFAKAWIPKDAEKARFSHSKSGTFEDATKSTWKAATGAARRPFSAVVFANPIAQVSTWCCIDFDWHVGPPFREEITALLSGLRALAAALAAERFSTLTELSGRGCHFWIIPATALNRETWTALKARIVDQIPPWQGGQVEWLPTWGCKGHGARLPGSANPNTWNATTESWENSRIIDYQFLPDLREKLSVGAIVPWGQAGRVAPADEGERGRIGTREREKENTFLVQIAEAEQQRPEAGTPREKAINTLVSAYPIRGVAARHKALAKMVGNAVYVVPFALAKEAARRMHQQASPLPRTPLDEHMTDLRDCWEDFIQRNVIGRFNPREREKFESLESERHRTLFCLWWSLHRLRNPFHIPGTRFASICQVSVQTAYNDRELFERLGIICRCSASYQKGKMAQSFRWLLSGPSEGAAGNARKCLAGGK